MKSNTVQILTTVLSNTAVLAGVIFLLLNLGKIRKLHSLR